MTITIGVKDVDVTVLDSAWKPDLLKAYKTKKSIWTMYTFLQCQSHKK